MSDRPPRGRLLSDCPLSGRRPGQHREMGLARRRRADRGELDLVLPPGHGVLEALDAIGLLSLEFHCPLRAERGGGKG